MTTTSVAIAKASGRASARGRTTRELRVTTENITARVDGVSSLVTLEATAPMRTAPTLAQGTDARLRAGSCEEAGVGNQADLPPAQRHERVCHVGGQRLQRRESLRSDLLRGARRSPVTGQTVIELSGHELPYWSVITV